MCLFPIMILIIIVKHAKLPFLKISMYTDVHLKKKKQLFNKRNQIKSNVRRNLKFEN